MLVTDATNLPRLMNCPGSRLLPQIPGATGKSSQQLDQGTAAHWLIERAFADVSAIDIWRDRSAPNGVLIDAAMCEAVADYLNAVNRLGENFIEHVTSFEGTNWRVNSRADHIGWDGETLHVDDFKYGFRIVEPHDNWTLIAHAIGFCFARDIRPAKIILTIHQPRAYHPLGSVRSCEMDYRDLMALYGRLREVLTQQSATTRTGPHCHNCPAHMGCEASRKASLNCIDLADEAVNDDISDDLLSWELDQLKRAADMLKDRLGALENLAAYRIGEGRIIQNYAMESGLSNRRWNENLTPELVNALTGTDVASPKFITPAEAERRGVPKEVTAALTHRAPTGKKLVRVSAHDRATKLFANRKG